MKKQLFDFVFSPVAFAALLLAARAVFFTAIEQRWGKRRIPWKKVLPGDLLAFVVTILLIGKGAQILDGYIGMKIQLPAAVTDLPLAARFVLYVIAADFGAYWMHRLVHWHPLWRVHRWHHSPEHMYWFAGVRGSLLQLTIFNLPYIFMSPLFDISPWWIGNALLIVYAVTNDWMHWNVPWRLRWLDWLLVTPRTHQIHHSDQPHHYNTNYGVILSVWDRLFGTFTNPDSVQGELKFGITDRVSSIRMAIGI